VDLYSFAPIAAVLDAAYWLVTQLAQFVAPLVGSGSAAFAIVLITMIVRTVLIPVGVSQVRAELSRRRLAPQLEQLRRRYSKNRELLQRKTMELYTAEKVSPFAGCLPLLLQAPVLSVLYGLFILPKINGHPNDLLTEQLFSVPLGSSLVGLVSAGSFWPTLVVFGVLLAVIAVVATFSRWVAMKTAAPVPAQLGMAGLTSALSWMPFITVIFAAFVPLAATIYLTVSTTWTLVERVTLRRVLA